MCDAVPLKVAAAPLHACPKRARRRLHLEHNQTVYRPWWQKTLCRRRKEARCPGGPHLIPSLTEVICGLTLGLQGLHRGWFNRRHRHGRCNNCFAHLCKRCCHKSCLGLCMPMLGFYMGFGRSAKALFTCRPGCMPSHPAGYRIEACGNL